MRALLALTLAACSGAGATLVTAPPGETHNEATTSLEVPPGTDAGAEEADADAAEAAADASAAPDAAPIPDAAAPDTYVPPPTCAQRCASAGLVCGPPSDDPTCSCGRCTVGFDTICAGTHCTSCERFPTFDTTCNSVFKLPPHYAYNDSCITRGISPRLAARYKLRPERRHRLLQC